MPLEAVPGEEIEALEEQLDDPAQEEEGADLSSLDDEGIRREAKREVVRRRRNERKAARVAYEDESARRSVERGVQIGLLGLLMYIAAVATVVAIVGAFAENVEIVQIGVAALCAVGGLGIYRLPFWVGRR